MTAVYPPYVWQSQTWQHLIERKEQGRLPHALLLSGPRGWGKTALANAFSQQLLCQESNTQPCLRCKNCLLVQSEDGHPDFMRIQPDGKMAIIKVDSIREVVSFMSQTAQQGGYRVIIIEQAQMMNVAASNCLLKTLEEPGSNSLIILVSDAPELLLPTIRSRCQEVICQTALIDEVTQWLEPYLNNAQFSLPILWQLSHGAPLAIKSWVENGFLEYGEWFIRQFLQPFTAISFANECSKQSLSNTLFWLMHLLSDAIKIKSQATEAVIFNYLRPELTKIVSVISLNNLLKYLQKCYHCRQVLNQKISVNETLMLEDLLISWKTLS